MDRRDGKCKKCYVGCPSNTLPLTCLIHGPGQSSDKYTFLGNFGKKYSAGRPSKDIKYENINKRNKEVIIW